MKIVKAMTKGEKAEAPPVTQLRERDKKQGISWRLAFHEASHAVIAHLAFGEGSIRSVSAQNGSGMVKYQDPFCHSRYDIARLPVAMAGTVGEMLFTLAADNERTPAECAKDDQKLIDEILSYNFFLPANYVGKQKKHMRQCLKHPFVRAAVCDVAGLLYEKLFRIAYVKKSIKATLVHDVIKGSFTAFASRTGSDVKALCLTVRKEIFPVMK